MITTRLAALVLTLPLLCACASSAPLAAGSDSDPWGGIQPGDEVYLSEGGSITVEIDDVRTADVRMRDGHLWLNGEDLGAHDRSDPIHLLRDGTLVVGDTARGHLR